MREEAPFQNVPTRRETDLVVPEGLEAGLLGGLAVACVYLLGDLAAGDWLRTPRLLGAWMLGDAGSATAAESTGYAAVFHGVHFAGWTLLGFATSALVSLAERRALRLRLAFALAAVGLGAATWALDRWLPELPGGAPLWVGGLVGSVTLLAFLAVRHPAVVRRRDRSAT